MTLSRCSYSTTCLGFSHVESLVSSAYPTVDARLWISTCVLITIEVARYGIHRVLTTINIVSCIPANRLRLSRDGAS